MRPRLPPLTALALSPLRPQTRTLSGTRALLDEAPSGDAESAIMKTRTNVSKKEKETAAILEAYRKFMAGPAENFKTALYNETNYLGSYELDTYQRKSRAQTDVPFPVNYSFRAPPVLSDEFRAEIHRQVMERGRSVRSVSAQFGVSLERVAAVVRLKEVERELIEKDNFKPATFLTKCLGGMMKVTELPRFGQGRPPRHEDIQELAIHKRGLRQAFVPVSEGRRYTRADAGKELGLPAPENAVPHPELVAAEKERAEGVELDERIIRERERDRLLLGRLKEKRDKARAEKAALGRTVEHGRWKWRLQEAEAGKFGHRYGIPHEDRKKWQVKIPTRVE